MTLTMPTRVPQHSEEVRPVKRPSRSAAKLACRKMKVSLGASFLSHGARVAKQALKAAVTDENGK